MKRLLPTALVLCTMAAWAEHGANELPLTAKNKAHLVQVLSEALNDKDISQQQYKESIAWVNATPCKGVDRSLSAQRQAQLESAIAKERGRQKVKVFDSFRKGGWFIVFSDASDGDEPYLFYSDDPIKGAHPITAWSGAAAIFETSAVAKSVKEDAPGIPATLANCFAWHVTLGQE